MCVRVCVCAQGVGGLVFGSGNKSPEDDDG